MSSTASLRAHAILSPFPPSQIFQRYATASAMAILSVLLRAALDPALGHVAFYITVYMAIAFTVLLCGVGPAVLAALMGFLGVFYYFVDPRHSFSVIRQSEIHGIVGFSLMCATLIWLGNANRAKQLKLNQSVNELTKEAAQRRQAEAGLREAHEELEQRVEQRTAELSLALASLQKEVVVRKSAEDQLRNLSVRLMSLQDEERRRIARELHDTTGQSLSALKMSLGLLERDTYTGPANVQLLEEINRLADDVLREIRTTSYLLHPPLLDEMGFRSAARWFVEGFAKRSNIDVQCDIPQQMDRLPKESELVLFRVLQESLTNVHRHSEASMAAIAVRNDSEKVELRISDNGRGIDASKLNDIQSSHSNLGVGILGMRERARQLGGQLEIVSDRTGTTVTLVLPAST